MTGLVRYKIDTWYHTNDTHKFNSTCLAISNSLCSNDRSISWSATYRTSCAPAPPPTGVRRHCRIYRTYAKEHTNAKCGFQVCITTDILSLFASWRFIYFAPLDEWLVGICWSSKLQSSILQHTGHGKLQMPFCASNLSTYYCHNNK